MNKYRAIANLEETLKMIESDYCYAMRSGDREAADELYVERGEVIRELQRVA